MKTQLLDGDGFLIIDVDINALPVIQILFDAGASEYPKDVIAEALFVGMGTEDNQFEFNTEDNIWQFNLKTKNYTAAGTYTIIIKSGDDTEYSIDPTCTATFIIE